MSDCPSWCTIHVDLAWDGAHYSDPVHIPLIIRTTNNPEPVEVIASITADDNGEWVSIEPVETGGPSLTLDTASAQRLADACRKLIDLA